MAFPTTSTLDDFTRANAGTLGANWTANVDGATVGHQLTSNQAQPLGNFASDYWNVTTFGPDSEARITMATKPGTGFNVGCFARLVTPGSAAVDGYYFGCSVLAGTDDHALFRIDNGAFTQLGASGTQELASNDTIGIEIIGTSVSGYINNTLKFSRTDATYAAAGYIGFEGDQTAGRYDDFLGGTVVAAGATLVTRRALLGVGI